MDELRAQWLELTGKRAFYGWDEEQLKSKIESYETGGKEVEEKDIKEVEVQKLDKNGIVVADIESLEIEKRIKSIKDIPMVFVGGDPYAIIGGYYVNYEQAKLMVQRKICERENKLLKEMESLT